MPNDVPDYTSAVQVTAGSISITGTPTVLVSGTVAVSITGANTVILGAGSNTIGSISAIGSTVTVAGTVNIGGTPAVTISGTPTVNIGAGSVSITGTANINIQGQSITVNTNQPQSLVMDADIVGPVTSNSSFTSLLPAGTHAVEVYFSAGTVPLSRIDSWNLQGGVTANYYRNFTTSPDTLAYPIRISGLIENNGLKVNTHFTPPLIAGEKVHVKVVAILDSAVPTLTDQSGYAHIDPLQALIVGTYSGQLQGTFTTGALDTPSLTDYLGDGAALHQALDVWVGGDRGEMRNLIPLGVYTTQQQGQIRARGGPWKGLAIILRVTVAGTGALNPFVFFVDSTNTLFPAIWIVAVQPAAAGSYYYLLYPGAVASGNFNEVKSVPIVDGCWLAIAKTDASPWTFRADVQLVQ